MRGLREHLTLLLATAVWSVLLGNRAALVGREAHEESSVLPAAPRTNTHTHKHAHTQNHVPIPGDKSCKSEVL